LDFGEVSAIIAFKLKYFGIAGLYMEECN